MNGIKYFFFCLLLLIVNTAIHAQSAEVPSEIISAINTGDASKLSSYLNANVELVIGNKNDVFSKQQATGIINNFFKSNKTLSFSVLHKGNKEASSFAIGTLKSSSGNFRVYLLIRKSGNQTVIQQLRIEPSND